MIAPMRSDLPRVGSNTLLKHGRPDCADPHGDFRLILVIHVEEVRRQRLDDRFSPLHAIILDPIRCGCNDTNPTIYAIGETLDH
jgi:hypothetical protein